MDLFSGTLKRPKLRPNWIVTEEDRDRTEIETETWTEWCAKNWTGSGPPNPNCPSLYLFVSFLQIILRLQAINPSCVAPFCFSFP